ncbi:hypothetical protein GCM10020229_28790 [Kitasatospora albolonga]|uniref:hypothetical protein n=1 Tax=Kitasatospora albolonga TaxID=68173 RepID=UPI0031EEC3FB
MDTEITLLASTAGTTIATLLATSAWNGVRDGVLALWRRARPDHEAEVAAQLEASRRELLRAESEGDEETGQEIAAEWQGRLRRFLVAHPDQARELRELLNELGPDVRPSTVVDQRASASGSARVYQAGRDLTIEQR